MVDHPEQPSAEAPLSQGKRAARAASTLAEQAREVAGRTLVQGQKSLRAGAVAARAGLDRGQKSLRSGAAAAKTRFGPRVAATGRGIASHTGEAGRAVTEMTRRHLMPRIAAWFDNLAQRTRPGVLKEDYRRILMFFHETVLDRGFEQLVFLPTRGTIPLKELTIQSLMRLSGHDYRPSPCKVFEWALSPLADTLKRRTFVDMGSGRGRVLLLAAKYDFDKVIGVEFAEELFNDCQMNIAQYPRSRMKCRDVECVLEDAAHFQIPDQNLVFYFFKPFDPVMLEEVLARIARSYEQRQRPMHLVFVDPPDPLLLKRWTMFRPIPLERWQALKIKYMSPYGVAVYHTVESGNVPPPPRPAN